jgi:hypothetical protein
MKKLNWSLIFLITIILIISNLFFLSWLRTENDNNTINKNVNNFPVNNENIKINENIIINENYEENKNNIILKKNNYLRKKIKSETKNNNSNNNTSETNDYKGSKYNYSKDDYYNDAGLLIMKEKNKEVKKSEINYLENYLNSLLKERNRLENELSDIPEHPQTLTDIKLRNNIKDKIIQSDNELKNIKQKLKKIRGY